MTETAIGDYPAIRARLAELAAARIIDVCIWLERDPSSAGCQSVPDCIKSGQCERRAFLAQVR